jgi:hypothetical protein
MSLMKGSLRSKFLILLSHRFLSDNQSFVRLCEILCVPLW